MSAESLAQWLVEVGSSVMSALARLTKPDFDQHNEDDVECLLADIDRAQMMLDGAIISARKHWPVEQKPAGSERDTRKVQEAVDYVLNSNLQWPEYVVQLALASQEWLAEKPRGPFCSS